MEMKALSIRFVMLSIFGTFSCVSCTSSSLRLSRDYNFDGLTCPESSKVFNAENIQSAAQCAAICTEAPSCVGVFYQPLAKECVGCTSIYKDDAPSLPGTEFYGRGCFELPAIVDGIGVFDHIVSENSVVANVTCNSWYISRKEKITCEADTGWETAECADCYLGEPVEYYGKRNWTVSGIACQRWDSQSPHGHEVTHTGDNFPDDTIEDAGNYCRYPGQGEIEPWCYTIDTAVRWGYCDIFKCT